MSRFGGRAPKLGSIARSLASGEWADDRSGQAAELLDLSSNAARSWVRRDGAGYAGLSDRSVVAPIRRGACRALVPM